MINHDKNKQLIAAEFKKINEADEIGIMEFDFEPLERYMREYEARMVELEEALAAIKSHPNCRYEVEAQIGEDIWEVLNNEQ